IDITGATLNFDQYDNTTILFENNKLKTNPEPAFDTLNLGPDRSNNTANAIIHIQSEDTIHDNCSIFLESDYDNDAGPNSYDLTRIISTNHNMDYLCMIKHNLESMEFLVSRTPSSPYPKIKFRTNGLHLANDEHRPPNPDEYVRHGPSVLECHSDDKVYVIYGLGCPLIFSTSGT